MGPVGSFGQTEKFKRQSLNNGEYQVTFLQDVKFVVKEIIDRGNGKIEIVMDELLEDATEGKILYHISPIAYAQGEIVSAKSFSSSTNYHRNLSEVQKAMDDYLSDMRPENEPARNQCIYAFDKPEYCVYFCKDTIRANQEMHLYKCKANILTGHPMILVGQLEKTEKEQWLVLRDEYWYPTKNWNLKEYLLPEMEVLEEIPIPPLRCRSFFVSNNDYANDVDIANKIRKF